MLPPFFTPLFTIALPPVVVCLCHRRYEFWRRARLTWLTLSLWMMALMPVCQVVMMVAIDALNAPSTSTLAHVPYGQQITAAANRHGLKPELLAGLVATESGFNATAVSGSGAMGLTQIMPATAAELGLMNPYDAAANLDAGARYLAWLIDYFGGDEAQAIMAYHGGPGRIMGGQVRPIDRQYLASVQAAQARYEVVALVPSEARITSLPQQPTAWKGVDYAMGCGAAILAPVAGTVVEVGFDGFVGEYGSNNSYLIIEAGDGREVILLHGEYTAVVGTAVGVGDVVGYEASVGNSTGCHTDISIRSK